MTIIFHNGDTIKTNLNIVFHKNEYKADILVSPKDKDIVTINLKDIKRIEQ